MTVNDFTLRTTIEKTNNSILKDLVSLIGNGQTKGWFGPFKIIIHAKEVLMSLQMMTGKPLKKMA